MKKYILSSTLKDNNKIVKIRNETTLLTITL